MNKLILILCAAFALNAFAKDQCDFDASHDLGKALWILRCDPEMSLPSIYPRTDLAKISWTGKFPLIDTFAAAYQEEWGVDVRAIFLRVTNGDIGKIPAVCRAHGFNLTANCLVYLIRH